MSTDLEEAVPIREVSRLTGVNSVTLRAWERRYGLLKPLRTAKGHRLYRPEDIARIAQVQSWLARGVAVSQVRTLIDSPVTEPPAENAGELWGGWAERLIDAVTQLRRTSLERMLAELSALYPPTLLADQLLEPVLQQFRAAQQNSTPTSYGCASQLALLEVSLQRHFYSALYRQEAHKHRGGHRWLLVDQNRRPDSVLPMILSYSLGVNDTRVDYFGSIPQSELVFAVEQLGSTALLLYADHTPLDDWELRHPQLEQQLQIPIWLGGRQVALCPPSLEAHCLGQTHESIIGAVRTIDGEAGGSIADGAGAPPQ